VVPNNLRASCLADCTDAQLAAIQHVNGPLLVIAGPGSGKTRVITRRIGYMVAEGIAPYRILAITFTNKAAGEMRERVEAMGVPGGAQISTFHSFCARILRRYGQHVGLTSGFSIYDTSDSLAAIKRAMSDLEIDPKEVKPSKILRMISNAKNRLEGPEDVTRNLDPDMVTMAKVYERYQALLLGANASDFDDLLLLTVKLLQTVKSVKDKLHQQYTHILVDEYQDTNLAQYQIARHLAEGHNNLCVTGDPDQSIYGWRGANLNNILEFEKDYLDAKSVRLEQNYRSTKKILQAASGLIKHNVARKEKELWTDNPEGELVNILSCADEREEAQLVAGDISVRIRKGEIAPKDVAVFYRTNAQTRVLERAFQAVRVPYQIVAGTEFYQRAEIKDLLAYLRLVVNPSDDVSAMRVANVPSRKVGATSMARIAVWAREHDMPIVEAMRHIQEVGIRGPALGGISSFLNVIRELRAMPQAPVAPIVEKLLHLTQFEAHLRGMDKGDERVLNARELVNAAAEFNRAEPESELGGFLEEAALVSDIDKWDKAKGGVTLMTLHAAKGLEFPHAYVLGLEEGLLPLASSGGDRDIEEERRLLFVGITRAMKRVTLTYAQCRMRYGQTEYTQPSQFLDELPEDAISGAPAPAAPAPWRQASQRSFNTPRRAAQPAVRRVKRSETEEIVYDGEEPDDAAFSVGDTVIHPIHGRGKVVQIQGYGDTAKVKVSFHSVGFKLLVPQYANLRKV
jgi:ATP-dependent DNA helicase UvrD/PcrA